MANHRQSLKVLRRIALAHCRGEHPDLATLARELGSAVRSHADGLGALAARVRAGSATPLIRALRTGSASGLQLLLIAWPANHASALHDHGACWGLEIPLHGALEIDTWRRPPDGGAPQAQGRHWLGPGDALWFDANEARMHRCRNLSRREVALSLHLFGGAPTSLAYAPSAAAPRRVPPRQLVAGPLQG
ncbi:cysteine dioxygenase family protein [Fulvimonas yonginensis]|uniref:Cysteine dioxygenase family protein n=1 Tax=Fulvimonas yonginensis TaxID=1495200 RepID=A0ABU8JE64_9GAMM